MVQIFFLIPTNWFQFQANLSGSHFQCILPRNAFSKIFYLNLFFFFPLIHQKIWVKISYFLLFYQFEEGTLHFPLFFPLYVYVKPTFSLIRPFFANLQAFFWKYKYVVGISMLIIIILVPTENRPNGPLSKRNLSSGSFIHTSALQVNVDCSLQASAVKQLFNFKFLRWIINETTFIKITTQIDAKNLWILRGIGASNRILEMWSYKLETSYHHIRKAKVASYSIWLCHVTQNILTNHAWLICL